MVTRIEAETIVAPVVELIPQEPPYRPAQGITAENAHEILGEERFSRLLRDPIRKHGPKPGYVYPWNVTDYVQFPDLRKEED